MGALPQLIPGAGFEGLFDHQNSGVGRVVRTEADALGFDKLKGASSSIQRNKPLVAKALPIVTNSLF